MADKGKKYKVNREVQKKAKLTQKQKPKLKKEKKSKQRRSLLTQHLADPIQRPPSLVFFLQRCPAVFRPPRRSLRLAADDVDDWLGAPGPNVPR